MLCSRFLRPPHAQRHGWLYNAFERMFQGWLWVYDRTLRLSLRFKGVTAIASVALLFATGYLFGLVPKGFLPSEDQGRFQINTEAMQGISYPEMVRHQTQVADIVAKDPDVASTMVNVGAIGNFGGALNSGRIWAELKPRSERQMSVDQKIAELRPTMAQIPGIRVFMTNQPPINLGGTGGGSRGLYQFTLQDTDTDELYKWAPILEEKIRQYPGPRGCQQRPAAQESAGDGRDGPRQGLDARPDREPGRDRALQRLWHAPGLADLCAQQSVPGDSPGGARISNRSSCHVAAATCAPTPAV